MTLTFLAANSKLLINIRALLPPLGGSRDHSDWGSPCKE